MTLSHQSLERLLRKESWREARWIGDDLLGYIHDEQVPSLHLLGLDRLHRLTSKARLGTSLDPQGPSFVASTQSIYGLSSEPLGLITWSLRDLSPEPTWEALATPCTGLALDPAERWLSYLTFQDSRQSWLVLTRFLTPGSPWSCFGSLPAIPYSFEWAPRHNFACTLLAESGKVPWQHCRLALLTYEERADGPRLSQLEYLHPPAPAEDICLEAHFSPCGTMLIGLWQTGPWFQLWLYDLRSKRWQQRSFQNGERAPLRKRFDTRTFAIHPLENEILSLRQQRGFFHLDTLTYLGPTDQKAILVTQDYSELKHLSLSPSGEALSLIAASSQLPPTQVVIKKKAKDWLLTHQRRLHTAESRLQPEVLSWPSLDGEQVYGFLYRDARRQGPQPLLMPIHAGPSEQVTATWPIKAQVFVEQGYSVLYVNYRGSWGFGRDYHQALAGRWGQLEVIDIVSALLTLSATGWIDPQRVAIWGGDCAGTTVLQILQRYPHVFRAAIAVYPICELQDFWERANPMRRAELDWALGTTDPELRRQRSPLHHAELIQTPLALFHGAQDALVPLDHIQQLEASLRQRDVPVWCTVYQDEGHALSRQQNLEDYYCKVASFLARFLRKDTRPRPLG